MTTVPTGLLYSRIGYAPDVAQRFVVRGPSELFSGPPVLRIDGNGVRCEAPLISWGDLWGSHWWVVDVRLAPGRYHARVTKDGIPVGALAEAAFRVEPDVLWRETGHLTGLQQAEMRQDFALPENGHRVGWFDAGMHWQEANSHASFVFGLCDVLQFRGSELHEEDRARWMAQLRNGCAYLELLQDRAGAQGGQEASGALLHQSFDRTPHSRRVPLNRVVLPADAAKAAAAWARTARFLESEDLPGATRLRTRAHDALRWLLESATYASLRMHPLPHRLSEHSANPPGMPTDDLAMVLDALVELEDPRALDYARQLLERQIPRGQYDGAHGMFGLFANAIPLEPLWHHGAGPDGMSFDNGATHGHHLFPLIKLVHRFPRHPDAAGWRAALESYVEGFLLPGSRANPFGIVPNQFVPGEGFIWFAGLWHGANAIYGNTAALAMELGVLLQLPVLQGVANANLQWVAGLNAGITREALAAARMADGQDVPPGIAVPASMIHRVGDFSAGSWLNVRGSICNGFAVGSQFQWDIPPESSQDGPHSFTDEDWITHAGGWLSGVARWGKCESPEVAMF